MQLLQRRRAVVAAADDGHRHRQEADHQGGHGDAARLHRRRQQDVVEGVAGKGEPEQVQPVAPSDPRRHRLPPRRQQRPGDQAIGEVASHRQLQGIEVPRQLGRQEDQPPQRACADAASDAERRPVVSTLPGDLRRHFQFPLGLAASYTKGRTGRFLSITGPNATKTRAKKTADGRTTRFSTTLAGQL
ncbi:hypothetical protein D3C73_851470 [compost metagenome]